VSEFQSEEPRAKPWVDEPVTSGHDDPDLHRWLLNIVNEKQAGDFLKLLAMAALRADHENYPLLRPALLKISKRYPKYNE
jgi:hypothetical protein